MRISGGDESRCSNGVTRARENGFRTHLKVRRTFFGLERYREEPENISRAKDLAYIVRAQFATLSGGHGRKDIFNYIQGSKCDCDAETRLITGLRIYEGLC